MAQVVLESVDAAGAALRYDYRATGRVGRFFTDRRFAADYDVDVSGVPASILAIPWLANVCPVAWAAGASVWVPRMDATFLASLRRVRTAMVDLYPEFMTGGPVGYGTLVGPPGERDESRSTSPTVRPTGESPTTARGSTTRADLTRPAVPGTPASTEESRSTAGGPPETARDRTPTSGPPGRFHGSALLFSGGVDSLTTYVRHREEAPALVAIGGADVDVEERAAWRENRRLIEAFAAERDLTPHFVATDMHGFLDGQLLRAHYQRYLDDTWWAAVQHGLGLLGLCAPLAYARGFGDLYIAATHTADYDRPWGSHPAIDDEVAWTGTTAHHDGYELSRQEKLGVLADYVETAAPDLTIRACHESAGGGNCNECEKCARTVVGLLLAGMDPEERGYELDPAWFPRTRQRLAAGHWRLGTDEQFMWEDLQRHVDTEREYSSPGADAFMTWLADVRVADLVAAGSEADRREYVRRAARTVPYPVYRVLRALQERVG